MAHFAMSSTLNPTTTLMMNLHSTSRQSRRRFGNSSCLYTPVSQDEEKKKGKMNLGFKTIHDQLNGQGNTQISPNKVIINVGGTRFETYRSTLKNIPDTRLAWITESKADNPDYDPLSGEYFFDRHPSMFLMILNYYRTGKLHTPSDVCGPAFEEELLFWGIDEKQVESCCWGSYSQHRDAQHTLEELRIDTNNAEEPDDYDGHFGSTAEKFGITENEDVNRSSWDRMKPKLWSVIDGHSGSMPSKIFTGISLLMTLSVITAFILETHQCCRVLRNESDPYPENPTNRQFKDKTKPSHILMYIEIVGMIELTIETILRFVSCPSKKSFMKNPLNIFDLVALISFYITVGFFIDANGSLDEVHLALQWVRVFRVFRIFKVATHLQALKILFHTLKASARELILMIMLIGTLVVIFASFIYLAEQINEDPNNDFASIPVGFWWAIVTMTTLGYGDKAPRTTAGYMVGSVCALCGVLFIALPIPIIVNNFSTYYTHAKAQEKLPKKRKVALVGAADALKQVLTDSTPLGSTRSDLISDCSSQDSRSASPTPDRDHPSELSKPHQLMKHLSKTHSNGSALSNTGGINVTFTGVDEDHETQFNGGAVLNSNGSLPHQEACPDIKLICPPSDNNNSLLSVSPDTARRKKGTSSMAAMARRASLLPGGVSNQPHAQDDSSGAESGSEDILKCDPTLFIITEQSDDENDDNNCSNPDGSHKSSLTLKAPGPRERRRSLMPATYGPG